MNYLNLDGRRTLLRTKFYIRAHIFSIKSRKTHKNILILGSRGNWVVRGTDTSAE
jgi:hypothetical protein